MPLFYSGQTDYIDKLNILGNEHVVTTLTAVSSTGAQSRDMNLALGSVFSVSITAAGIVNLTLTFSNVPSNTPMSVMLYISSTGTYAHTFAALPTTTRTLAGQTPPQTASQTSIYRFNTLNGTTWYLETVGQAYTT